MLVRLRVLLGIFIFAWGVLVARLFYWQVKSFDKLFLAAKLQQQAREEITTNRGRILTSDNFPLVSSAKSYLMFIQPNLITEVELTFDKIRQQVLMDKEKFLGIATNPKIHWYPLVRSLSSEKKENIEKLQLKGIGFEPQWLRTYPESSMAAHLLGLVGTDNLGDEKGYYGLEGFYDRELKGVSGERLWERDLIGRPIIIGEDIEKKSKPGRDLYLFLDRSVQFIAEKHLREGIEKYRAVSGSVIVMDPKSGGILAMASFPAYDPANFINEDKNNLPNPAISSSFEPGSIFKPLVMAAAVDLDLVSPETICTSCDGPVQIGEYTIKTWNEKYYAGSTVTEILLHSDNVGMVFVAEKLGVKKLLEYLRRFGLGEKTGVDLQEESDSPLREENSWLKIDLATAGFGQGIAVTPIQMVRAMGAIANKGKLVTPQVVKKIKEDDREIFLKFPPPKQIIKPQTARIITQMMVEAVEKGEAGRARPKGYLIAGKTGTAQVPISGHYDEKKTVASFIGFAPADDPRFVMIVSLREPKTSPWGTTTAAPIWFEVAKEIFRIWGIPPS